MIYDNWIKYWNMQFHDNPTLVYIQGAWVAIWETMDGMFYTKEIGRPPRLIGDAVQTDEFLNQNTQQNENRSI